MKSTLLAIQASPRSARSQSRLLGNDFIASWKLAHPDGVVQVLDLAETPPPFVTEAWVEGAFTDPNDHSPAAQAAMRESNHYVEQLLGATEIVVATPMYNLSIPAALKAWIDQIVRVGRTFTFANGSFKGLTPARRVSVIVSSGSDFRPGTPGEGYNFVEPYLRALFGFIGITDVRFVYAPNMNQGEPSRSEVLAEARQTLKGLAA